MTERSSSGIESVTDLERIHRLARWVAGGTRRFLTTVADLSDAALDDASLLPGWRRTQVIAHIWRNAEALTNLLVSARPGIVTPMYASPQQRNADIEATAGLSSATLRAGLSASAERFAAELDAVRAERWAAPVRTASGRTVALSEVPWLRVREVWIHAVDLDAGVRLADVPIDVLSALADDVSGHFAERADAPRVRLEALDVPGLWETGGTGTPRTVVGDVASLAAYLLGRTPGTPLRTIEGAPLPAMPPWL